MNRVMVSTILSFALATLLVQLNSASAMISCLSPMSACDVADEFRRHLQFRLLRQLVTGAPELRTSSLADGIDVANKPLVSVLLLAHNHGSYIAQAIEGVLEQCTDVSLELLIGEDCSTDATPDIVARYAQTYPEIIRVITSDTNVGAWKNYQRLLCASSGAFLAYLDGDDYWLPGKLAPQVAFLRENPDCAAIYTNAIAVNQHGERVALFNDAGSRRFDLSDLLRRGNFLNHSSMVFRSKSIGLINEMDKPFIDYRVHLRQARMGWLQQLAEPLTVYRLDSASSMASRSNEFVRELYWEAILDVPRNLISSLDLAMSIADFLRRVVVPDMRKRRYKLLHKWIPRALDASPYGVAITSLLTLLSLLRTIYGELAGRRSKGPNGQRLRVLFRC